MQLTTDEDEDIIYREIEMRGRNACQAREYIHSRTDKESRKARQNKEKEKKRKKKLESQTKRKISFPSKTLERTNVDRHHVHTSHVVIILFNVLLASFDVHLLLLHFFPLYFVTMMYLSLYIYLYLLLLPFNTYMELSCVAHPKIKSKRWFVHLKKKRERKKRESKIKSFQKKLSFISIPSLQYFLSIKVKERHMEERGRRKRKVRIFK